MKKRLLGILLSFALMLTMMPVLGMSQTAYAAGETWSESFTTDGGTIDGGVYVTADITLTIPDGITLNVNGGISGGKTLTVVGKGTLIINGMNGSDNDGRDPSALNGGSGGVSFTGNIIVDGPTVTVTGGTGGKGGLSTVGGSGGSGGNGVEGDVTVNSGSIETTGGNGGKGGDGESGGGGGEAGVGINGVLTVTGGSATVTGGTGGEGGGGESGGLGSNGADGITGDVTVTGGSATVTGGTGGKDGDGCDTSDVGKAVSGTITGSAEESDDNSNWRAVSGTTSTMQYVKVTPSVTAYPLWVGGTQVTSANKDDVLKGTVNAGKVSFTPAKDGAHAKLTLKGANITEGYDPYQTGYRKYGIYYTGNEALDITLESDSENTIKVEGTDFDGYGIYSRNADLAINGTGKVTAIGSYYGIRLYDNNNKYWDLTIKDAAVNASGTNSCAVEAKNIEIINANVTATAKEVGISAVDSVTIKGGTVTASGGYRAIYGPVKNFIAGTGWDDTEGTGTEHAIEINEDPGQKLGYKKVQFPAVVKVTVEFDSAGGSAVKAQTINKGAKAKKPTDPTKDGYTFDGWYLGSTAFDFSTAVNEDITLVAHWKKNSTPTGQSTITYDLNGGTLNGETGKVAVKVNNGTEITLPAPTRDGYTFDYWEGSKYNAGDKYTVNGDHTFKAVWKTGASGDGSKGGSSSGKNGVKTGDENTLGAWIVLLMAALAGTTGMVFARKRRND